MNIHTSANLFSVTIIRTRPSQSVLWFDDALRISTNEAVDNSMGGLIISKATTSENNLIRTVVKVAETRENLESYLSALNDPTSVYYGITAYSNAKNITTSISDITEISNPDYIAPPGSN